MLNNSQIKLVQVAARAAGLRGPGFDGRYRLLLKQYKQSDGSCVTSCKQLNNYQLDDFLAICEANGFAQPGKPPDFYRSRVKNSALLGGLASFAQQQAIKYLAGDLGWSEYQLAGFIKKMTKERADSIDQLTASEGHKIIEALKSIFGRKAGKSYTNLKQIQSDMEVKTKDGVKKKSQVG